MCRLEYARQWAIRITHEAEQHDENCFITLTYSPKELPDNGSLVKRDLQLFWKRLRKQLDGRKIRYFAAGEYGDKNNRPHYHACVFGYYPSDSVSISNRGDSKLFNSPNLDEVWGKGGTTHGDLTFESASYVARYVTKKITGERASAHYERLDESTGEIITLLPEFAAMSRRPGIGSSWYQKYGSDVYPSDETVVRGRVLRPPKFYDRKLEQSDPELLESLKAKRVIKAKEAKITPSQLTAKEKISLAKSNLKKRKL